MILENRLRALIRTTTRGKSYPDQSLSIGVKVFLKDILILVNPLVLGTLTDDMLINNYFCWEKIMFDNQDDPQARLNELIECLQVTIVPGMTKKELETEIKAKSTIVNLFPGTSIH